MSWYPSRRRPVSNSVAFMSSPPPFTTWRCDADDGPPLSRTWQPLVYDPDTGRRQSASGVPGVTALRADARRGLGDGHLGVRSLAAQAKLDPREVIELARRVWKRTFQPVVFGVGLVRQEVVPSGQSRHLELLQRGRLVILVGPAD